ncbi:hypothetical protein CROQUDRAFT_91491 [Cronartium quercuum f. sp. fusiforme G11]|uniref:Uncharacterized protein n=1 Tax=Cronartium quercuum f. sp. fusiforme G11 TaxID=708437 RepID=A0A9P6NKS8_9BASI|nr:hypothetical protein CROQUDRAFT_91491 [Cronartium quercuum f. sp. fusiforme G11]
MHNWLEGVLQHHFRHRWGFKGKGLKHPPCRTRYTEEDGSEDESKDTPMDEAWEDDFDLKTGSDESLFSEPESESVEVVVSLHHPTSHLGTPGAQC